MRLTLLYIVASLLITPVMAVAGCPADPALARLVAKSSMILTGISQTTPDDVDLAAKGGRYFDMSLSQLAWLKGQVSEAAIVVKAPATDLPYAPSLQALRDAYGNPRLFFLTAVDNKYTEGSYFAGGSPEALRTAEPEAVSSVEIEVARQADILAHQRPDKRLPHYDEVRKLIDQLAAIKLVNSYASEEPAEREQAVFDKLQSLSMGSVPAIIAQMDDRRPLAVPEIALANNWPDAFEATRHYGPEQIVDALDAILSQMTGESYGHIYNGGSEQERDAAVAGWRVYAADLTCSTVK